MLNKGDAVLASPFFQDSTNSLQRVYVVYAITFNILRLLMKSLSFWWISYCGLDPGVDSALKPQ